MIILSKGQCIADLQKDYKWATSNTTVNSYYYMVTSLCKVCTEDHVIMLKIRLTKGKNSLAISELTSKVAETCLQ